MASAQTLYAKAVANYKSACILLQNAPDDEEQLNFAGHHLQQAVELALKYLLEQDGVEYPKTHDIDQLIRIGHERNVDLHLDDYLEDHAEMLSSWEAKARYVLGYAIETKKIKRASQAIDEYLARIAKAERQAMQ